jgi:hypothetical protein
MSSLYNLFKPNLANLTFCASIYKLNITFAAAFETSILRQENESILDNTPAHRIECIHDIRMVWPPEASADEDLHQLATDCRHPVFMGCRIS